MGRPGVQRPLVLSAQGGSRCLHGRNPGFPYRRREAEVLQGLLCRGRPCERGRPLRPEPRDYDNDDAFDQKAAKGFIDIQGLSLKTWATKKAKVASSTAAAALKLDVVMGSVEPVLADAANY